MLIKRVGIFALLATVACGKDKDSDSAKVTAPPPAPAPIQPPPAEPKPTPPPQPPTPSSAVDAGVVATAVDAGGAVTAVDAAAAAAPSGDVLTDLGAAHKAKSVCLGYTLDGSAAVVLTSGEGGLTAPEDRVVLQALPAAGKAPFKKVELVFDDGLVTRDDAQAWWPGRTAAARTWIAGAKLVECSTFVAPYQGKPAGGWPFTIGGVEVKVDAFDQQVTVAVAGAPPRKVLTLKRGRDMRNTEGEIDESGGSDRLEKVFYHDQSPVLVLIIGRNENLRITYRAHATNLR